MYVSDVWRFDPTIVVNIDINRRHFEAKFHVPGYRGTNLM